MDLLTSLRRTYDVLADVQWRRLPRLSAYVALAFVVVSPVLLLSVIEWALDLLARGVSWLHVDRRWSDQLIMWADDIERWYLHGFRR